MCFTPTLSVTNQNYIKVNKKEKIMFQVNAKLRRKRIMFQIEEFEMGNISVYTLIKKIKEILNDRG